MILITESNTLNLTHAFIFISDVYALNLNVQNLASQQIILNGPIFYMKNVNQTFINNIEISGVTLNQFLHTYESDFIIL